uniref:Uncharacterized protein n=1 Tax=Anguilla anguilla TaxID=7936 RepID=A0A0E9STK5_ANGAN
MSFTINKYEHFNILTLI